MSARDYAGACAALQALITAHYRPTGHDAASTFGRLQPWLQARAPAARFAAAVLTRHAVAVQRLDLQEAVATLSVVHVAGTKGKARAQLPAGAQRRRFTCAA